jgi:hypothetical protein
MSDTQKAVEINCETGEVTERLLTPEEISQREADAAAFAEQRAAEEVAAITKAELKASAKTKLMAGLPLTAEEADVLVI